MARPMLDSRLKDYIENSEIRRRTGRLEMGTIPSEIQRQQIDHKSNKLSW